MTGFDANFIQEQAAALTVNMSRQLAETYDLVAAESELQKRITEIVAPAVVAFLGRLSAGAPSGEERLRPVLVAFFTNPDSARALGRLSGDDRTAAVDLSQLFLAAAADDIPISPYDFEDALAEFSAVLREATRQMTSQISQPEWLNQIQAYIHPSSAIDPADYRAGKARALIDSFRKAGISAIYAGRAIAADGTTVIFVWHAGWASAAPDEPPRMEESEPKTANGGAGTIPPHAPGLPPAPEPPQPPTVSVVALRLDAALPEKVVAGREFDLAVSIRQPASPVLAPDDLTRHESADFAALWPAGTPFISLRVQVAASGADVIGSDAESVRLFAGQDSPPVYFRLRPRQVGPISVIITVYQETDWIGSTRVVTAATGEEPRGQMLIHVNSRSVGDPEVNHNTLRGILDNAYNSNELKDLCFELGIDHEDIPGDTQSAKARELVLFARRRGLEARLVELVMRDRPHLLVPS
jgi:hypothetical protein